MDKLLRGAQRATAAFYLSPARRTSSRGPCTRPRTLSVDLFGDSSHDPTRLPGPSSYGAGFVGEQAEAELGIVTVRIEQQLSQFACDKQPGHDGAMADDPDVLELRVSNAPVGTNGLLIRMSPELIDEVQAKLDEAEIPHGEVLELSAGAELAIEMVQFVGGPVALGILAKVLHSVFHRNDGKKIVGENGEEYVGYSREDVERLIDKQWERQQENEEKWKKQIERDKGEDA